MFTPYEVKLVSDKRRDNSLSKAGYTIHVVGQKVRRRD